MPWAVCLLSNSRNPDRERLWLWVALYKFSITISTSSGFVRRWYWRTEERALVAGSERQPLYTVFLGIGTCIVCLRWCMTSPVHNSFLCLTTSGYKGHWCLHPGLGWSVAEFPAVCWLFQYWRPTSLGGAIGTEFSKQIWIALSVVWHKKDRDWIKIARYSI